MLDDFTYFLIPKRTKLISEDQTIRNELLVDSDLLITYDIFKKEIDKEVFEEIPDFIRKIYFEEEDKYGYSILKDQFFNDHLKNENDYVILIPTCRYIVRLFESSISKVYYKQEQMYIDYLKKENEKINHYRLYIRMSKEKSNPIYELIIFKIDMHNRKEKYFAESTFGKYSRNKINKFFKEVNILDLLIKKLKIFLKINKTEYLNKILKRGILSHE